MYRRVLGEVESLTINLLQMYHAMNVGMKKKFKNRLIISEDTDKKSAWVFLTRTVLNHRCCLTSQHMFDVGSRQKMTGMDSKRATAKCIATALVCQPC